MTDCPECSDGRSSTGQVGMQRDGQPIVCPRCHGKGLVLRERDYAALYKDGRCVLCDTPAYQESAEFHAAKHLSTGECVVQVDYRKQPVVERILITADVPSVDADGIGLNEHDGDTWDRTDPNSQALRQAHARNRETKRRLARAAKEAAMGGHQPKKGAQEPC